MGVELFLGQSSEVFNDLHYIVRIGLTGGAWITREVPNIDSNEDVMEKSRLIMRTKRLESNGLARPFSAERPFRGFFLKVKVKPDYTGLALARAGEEEDPILSVKDLSLQGKQEGMMNLKCKRIAKQFDTN